MRGRKIPPLGSVYYLTPLKLIFIFPIYELGNEEIRLDPHQTGVHLNVALAYLALNRVDEAKSVLEGKRTAMAVWTEV